jgi:hypothetical protein
MGHIVRRLADSRNKASEARQVIHHICITLSLLLYHQVLQRVLVKLGDLICCIQAASKPLQSDFRTASSEFCSV